MSFSPTLFVKLKDQFLMPKIAIVWKLAKIEIVCEFTNNTSIICVNSTILPHPHLQQVMKTDYNNIEMNCELWLHRHTNKCKVYMKDKVKYTNLTFIIVKQKKKKQIHLSQAAWWSKLLATHKKWIRYCFAMHTSWHGFHLSSSSTSLGGWVTGTAV